MPGFRKGKAPPSLVIQRLGFGAVLEEAIRDVAARVVRTGAARLRGQPGRRPRASRSSPTPEAEGEPLGFKFEVGVRPAGQARRRTRASRSAGPSPRSPDEIVDREVERIREGFARLEPVERAGRRGRRRC